MNIHKTLEKIFGYTEFRESQESIINSILDGEDVLAILPTGGGKSLCYQLPMIMSRGIGIVISPLISLMKDQVDYLREIGINADFINSSLDQAEQDRVIRNIQAGKTKILYMAPERLESQYFQSLIRGMDISLVAIDEAHCISQWGHDFRPSYQKIRGFLSSLPKKPIIGAFTATATKLVREDILEKLELDNPRVFVSSFDRPNIKFILKRDLDKTREILRDINNDESIIIYCNSRNNVERVHSQLKKEGYRVELYHGGMNSNEREEAQNNFIMDKSNIIVATNAFGMGIDKPDVRRVIHYNMPTDLESYYQEAGRAGRDGLKSQAILYFSPADIHIARLLVTDSLKPNKDESLENMINYSYTTNCLRNYILNYFGENHSEPCNNCTNCETDFIEKDYTLEAQKILSCIYRSEELYGAGMITDILKGSKNKRVLEAGMDSISTYGIMKENSREEIMNIIGSLLEGNYIKRNEFQGLKLRPDSLPLLKGETKHIVNIRAESIKEDKKKVFSNDLQEGLFQKLRELRAEISRDKNLPPYVIFHDKSLMEMVENLPQTDSDFLNISGVGNRKLSEYGQVFMDTIQTYIDEVGKIQPIKTDRPSRKPRKLTESAKETADLYMEGISLEEIGERRELAYSTILNHIEIAVENDYINKMENLYKEADVEKEVKDFVFETMDRLGSDFLGPIKEVADGQGIDLDYNTIRLLRIEKKIRDTNVIT